MYFFRKCSNNFVYPSWLKNGSGGLKSNRVIHAGKLILDIVGERDFWHFFRQSFGQLSKIIFGIYSNLVLNQFGLFWTFVFCWCFGLTWEVTSELMADSLCQDALHRRGLDMCQDEFHQRGEMRRPRRSHLGWQQITWPRRSHLGRQQIMRPRCSHLGATRPVTVTRNIRNNAEVPKICKPIKRFQARTTQIISKRLGACV